MNALGIRELKDSAPHFETFYRFHLPRYRFATRLLAPYLQEKPSAKILDIGISHLTPMISSTYSVTVDSLGFEQDGATQCGYNYQFNLNDTPQKKLWRNDIPQYDVIVMAEVIEHLYTAPEIVLSFVKSLLNENGILILQTPNAVSIQKRLKMLLGRNPFNRISSDPYNPGHFREYTMKELCEIAQSSGFFIQKKIFKSYFDARYLRQHPTEVIPQQIIGTLKNLAYPFIPSSLCFGITLILKNQDFH